MDNINEIKISGVIKELSRRVTKKGDNMITFSLFTPSKFYVHVSYINPESHKLLEGDTVLVEGNLGLSRLNKRLMIWCEKLTYISADRAPEEQYQPANPQQRKEYRPRPKEQVQEDDGCDEQPQPQPQPQPKQYKSRPQPQEQEPGQYIAEEEPPF